MSAWESFLSAILIVLCTPMGWVGMFMLVMIIDEIRK